MGQELGVVDSRTFTCGHASLLHPTPSIAGRVAMPHAHAGKEAHSQPSLGGSYPRQQGSSYQPSQGTTHPSKWNSTERTGARRRHCDLLSHTLHRETISKASRTLLSFFSSLLVLHLHSHHTRERSGCLNQEN